MNFLLPEHVKCITITRDSRNNLKKRINVMSSTYLTNNVDKLCSTTIQETDLFS